MSDCRCGRDDCPGPDACPCGTTCGCTVAYKNLKGETVQDGDAFTPYLGSVSNMASDEDHGN